MRNATGQRCEPRASGEAQKTSKAARSRRLSPCGRRIDHALSAESGRPALTAICERSCCASCAAARPRRTVLPLSTVPRRILAVKVHGLGDSVMVRSLLEHFRRRHPDVEIGVLAGPANRDVLTTGADYQLHRL